MVTTVPTGTGAFLSIELLSLVLAADAIAGGEDTTVCKRSAHDMHAACNAGVREELYTTVANCRNFAGEEDRTECREGAIDTKKEEVSACRNVLEARQAACDLLGENRYQDPLIDPENLFIDPAGIPGTYPPNPYVSLAAGHTYVLKAGEDGEETVVVHVTDETRDIQGVACRVVVDAAVEQDTEGAEVAYEAVEVTDDWFAQDQNGNVWYCGENSRNFEEGVLRDLGGSFEAGREFAKAGELIRAFPVVPESHRQEYSLGEAEDIVSYVDTMTAPAEDEGGDNEAFPCGPALCLKTLEFSPLEPESAEFKYYLPGTGFVLAVAMEDGEITGEREELVCLGDSLDVLEDPACGIESPQALLEALCTQSPAFCD